MLKNAQVARFAPRTARPIALPEREKKSILSIRKLVSNAACVLPSVSLMLSGFLKLINKEIIRQ
jgi:hypothetical protein